MPFDAGAVVGTIELRYDKAVKALKAVEQQTQRSMGQMGKFVKDHQAQISGLGIAMAAAGTGVLLMARSFVKAAGQMERYEAQFRVLTGSTEAAKARLKELIDFAAKTPFDLPGIIEADLLLQAFGLQIGTVSETLTLFGDTAAAMNVPISQVIRNFVKLKAGMFDMAELALIGVTRDKLRELGVQFRESGEVITRAELFPAALKLIEKFGGTMDEVSKTIEGRLSNLSDSFFQLKVAIGEGLLPVVKELTENVTAATDRMKDWTAAHKQTTASLTLLGTKTALAVTILGTFLAILPRILAGLTALKVALLTPAGLIAGMVALGIAIVGAANAWLQYWEASQMGVAAQAKGIAADKEAQHFIEMAISARDAAAQMRQKGLAEEAKTLDALALKYESLARIEMLRPAKVTPSPGAAPTPPDGKAAKAAQDALQIARLTLETKIEMALTDRERVQYETELADLLHRYGKEQEGAALTQVARNKLLMEEMALRRDMSKEQFEFAERDLEYRQASALSWAAERASLESMAQAYREQMVSASLNQTERIAAATRLLAIQREIKEGDEAFLAATAALNKARATTDALMRAALETELKGDRERLANAEQWGLTLGQQWIIEQRTIATQAELNRLNDAALALQREYTASLRLTGAEMLALYDQRIADQQTIITNAARESRSQQEIVAAEIRKNDLIRERAGLLLRQELAVIEERIATERAGYAEKIRLLQASLLAENDVTKQIEYRNEIRATGFAAVQAEIDKLREGGLWQLMSLEQQTALVARLLGDWSRIAGVALPEIQRQLTEMRAQLEAESASLRGFMLSYIDQIRSGISAFLVGVMQGTAEWRDFLLSVLEMVEQHIANIMARRVAEGLLAQLGQGAQAPAAEAVGGQQVTTQLTGAMNAWTAAATALPGPLGQWVGASLQAVAATGVQLKTAVSNATTAATNVGAATLAEAAAVTNVAAGALMEGASVGMMAAARKMAAAVGGGGDGAEGGGGNGLLGTILGVVMGLQHGGIVTRPTVAMIGERGPEAVIPLTGSAAALGGSVGPVYVTVSVDNLDDRGLRRLSQRLTDSLGDEISWYARRMA
ncbi:MAG TPA: hypothetical protein VM238_00115 [Phycisphaerae bacterium]|nr:hypothetical protein [Phycisphaerae bacterium]